MVLSRLIFSNLFSRKARTALTLAAIALAVSLVVAVTSGYTSARGAIYQYLASYMGASDLTITNANDSREGISQTVTESLRADKRVVKVFGRLETDTGLLDASGFALAGTSAQLIGVDRPTDDDVTRTPIEKGTWFDTPEGDVAVIDQRAAETLKVDVGGTIHLPIIGGPAAATMPSTSAIAATRPVGPQRAFKVVGICHKPAILADRVSWVYLPLKTAQAISGTGPRVTRVLVTLRRDTDQGEFVSAWQAQLKATAPDLKMKAAAQIRKEMAKNLAGIHFLSFLGGAVSLVAATFIIFSALSMGVSERIRTLAMLRAIGAFRGQIGRLVVAEAALLGMAGAVLGLGLGVLWSWTLVKLRSDFFSAGLVLDSGGMILGAGGSIAAALVASALPAWSASRVSPLEAMTPLAHPQTFRGPVLAALLGVLLIAIDPSVIYSGAPREVKFYNHFFLGLPAGVFGFFLLAPLVVWAVDLVLTWPLAWVMRIPPRLLRQQMSGGLWRAAGTGAALMVGLAILIVMQVMGNSVLGSWRLPDKFPDIFIWTTAQNGLTALETKELGQVAGIAPGQVTPLAIATPGLPSGWEMVGAALMPDATMFLGIEPDTALDMMELEFREGDRASAQAALKLGGHVIVTEEYRVLKGLKVGDSLALMTRNGKKNFTICGVVWSPGLDVMVTMFDMGKMFEERTVATVFGSVDDARKDFGKEKVFLFAANLQGGIAKEAVIENVKAKLGDRKWAAGDVRQIKFEIVKGFSKLLMLMTTVSFAAMAVAGLGVTNTVMAAVRSRQWQFGVLRSIGVTRGQLVRLVLAESALLGAVGCVLGVALGFVLSFNAMGLGRYILGFVAPMTVPWGMIGMGVGIVMTLALAAGVWPAVWVARTGPLSLLSSGRSAS